MHIVFPGHYNKRKGVFNLKLSDRVEVKSVPQV